METMYSIWLRMLAERRKLPAKEPGITDNELGTLTAEIQPNRHHDESTPNSPLSFECGSTVLIIAVL